MNEAKNYSNGRVDIKSPKTTDLFQLYDKIPVNQCATFRNPTEGLWDKNLLSEAFFSKENMVIIQNGIRAGVHKMSNGQYVIGNQDCDILKIIMRSIFLQNAMNQPNDITGQIVQLNKLVLDYSIPQVYGEVQSYYKYLNDVGTMYTPIAHPVMAQQHDKQLEFKTWF